VSAVRPIASRMDLDLSKAIDLGLPFGQFL
jgi:hypothetical protein